MSMSISTSQELTIQRIAKTTDLKDDAFYAEVVEVENEISKLRSTSRNLANYIPLLRFLEPIFWRKSAAHSAAVGNRRVAYNNELLRRLQDAVNRDAEVPCIQGNVLRDPEVVGLSNNELLSISFSMMAVCVPTLQLYPCTQRCISKTKPTGRR